MTVIAMTQEMGSLGKDVALGVTDALGLNLVRDEISEQVAQKLDTHTSALGRYLEGQAGLRERMSTDRRSLALYSAEEVFDYAAKDNVLIRGWGAVYLLRPVSHVICIRVCAPFEKRLKWVMERMQTDDQDFVADEIRRSDAARTANIRRMFNKTWGDPLDYDVVFNTERMSVASCVETMKHLLERPEFQKTEASQHHLENLSLRAKVLTALQNEVAIEHVRIDVEIDNGAAILSGIVVDDEERQICADIAAKVPGIQQVDNQLNMMAGHKTFR